MIGEIAAVVGLVAAGEAYLRAVGVTSLGVRIVVAFPIGASLTVTVGLLALVARVRVTPAQALAVTVLVALTGAALRSRVGREWTTLLWMLLVAACAVVAVRLSQLVKLTPDSFDYAWIGSLFAQYGSYAHHQALTLERRSLGIPFLHGIAGGVNGELFLPSVGPILALSGVALLSFAGLRLLRSRGVSGDWALLLTISVLAFAISTNRFVYHAFYLNSHMWFAVLTLLVGASALLVMGRDRSVSSSSLPLLLVPALAAMVLLRPEGGLVALLLVAPIVVGRQPGLNRRTRSWLLGSLGVVLVLWNGGVLWPKFGHAVPASVVGLTVLGVGLIGTAVVARHLERLSRAVVLSAAMVALAAAAALYSLRSPDIFVRSARATYENVVLGAGLWGRSLIFLSVVIAVALVLMHSRQVVVPLFPLLAYVPLAILLAYLRGGAYRVGAGDSLNRMHMHFFLLALLVLFEAMAGRRRRRWLGRRLEAEDVGEPRLEPVSSRETGSGHEVR